MFYLSTMGNSVARDAKYVTKQISNPDSNKVQIIIRDRCEYESSLFQVRTLARVQDTRLKVFSQSIKCAYTSCNTVGAVSRIA